MRAACRDASLGCGCAAAAAEGSLPVGCTDVTPNSPTKGKNPWGRDTASAHRHAEPFRYEFESSASSASASHQGMRSTSESRLALMTVRMSVPVHRNKQWGVVSTNNPLGCTPLRSAVHMADG